MWQSPKHASDSVWLEQLLGRLPSARVAVFGDLCLDAYWVLADTPGEPSLETGLPVRRVAAQRYSPGGAGNVAANLAALGVGHVEVIGLVGADLFGEELLRQLAGRGLPTTGVLQGPAGWQTCVYAKPCQGTSELNRLDFGGGNPSAPEVWPELLARLEKAAESCPVVVINQQVSPGWTAEALAALNTLIARHPRTLFIVDARDLAGSFPSTALKLNVREAARLLGERPEDLAPEDALRLAVALAQRQQRPVMVTRGEHGLVLATGDGQYDVPGIELPGLADSVGAGDAALAGFAAGWAAGAAPLEAGLLANHAAAITTRQMQTTGTATPAQLRALGAAPDYVHRPRLAAQPSLARYLPGTNLEIVTDRRITGHIRHAIFDHDGTISTLRHGWEAIMEPMMLKAIMGPRAAGCDDATRARLTAVVREFIDRTTGIQTLAQMHGLADLVRAEGFVAPPDVLDAHGYKAIYNEELLALVANRRTRLARGEATSGDWMIQNARPLLELLHAAGVTLYLASGTDEADVVAEARALGYAHLFTGGIFGAVGDLRIEAKRVVLERIIRAGGLGGGELVVFGDGPVEIREGRRRGAFTVGVASDEVRRHGLDARKRTRLIRAGADIVVPDFSQLDALWDYLGGGRTGQ